MGRVAREVGHFLTGVAFLTRLPVPFVPAQGNDALARAARWFPLAGILVGGIAAVVLLTGAALLPVPIAAGVAVAAGIVITGALHEDGLADTADGFGGRDRAHALEIMRDSRTGAFGVLALILSVGLRWAALSALPPAAGAAALVLAHSQSRAMIAVALAAAPYARPHGLASSARGMSAINAVIALVLAFAVGLAAGVAGLVALAAAALAGGAMLALLVRRLGGYTGDGLGAVQQAAEIAALLALAGFW